MNSTLITVSLTLAAGLVQGACSGLDTGNGKVGSVEVALSVADNPAPDSGGNAFTITAVKAHVRHVELKLPDGTSCEDLPGCIGDTIRIEGEWNVDLVTGTATPPIAPIDVPVGTVRRIDIRLAPDDATDLTLEASGTTSLQGVATPFKLALKFDETVRFESAAGFAVVADVVKDAVARLDPATWFATLPLTQCAEDGDLTIEAGTIVLEDGGHGCSGVENAVRDAIKASGTLE